LFKVTVQTSFWSPHQLTLADGKKERLHSHNWIVSAEVSGEKLNHTGLLIDFNMLKKLLDDITESFTNQTPENNEYFRNSSLSAEMIAKYIFENLQPQLPEHLILDCVSVTEEQGCTGKFLKKT
jgi:6-pyruvoyltetrahydropterin/6-carboxytetrahydropterin synthase